MTLTNRLVAALAVGTAVVLSGCAKKTGTVTQEAAGAVSPPPSPSPSALSGALAPAAGLLSGLTSSIPGMSQAQAILGAGSVLGVAKAKLPADQYSQVANAVPGANALVDEALKAGLPALNSLTGMSSVSSFLSKAGISPQMASQLVPALSKAITSGGGSQALVDAFTAAVQ
jgi:uncharacterized protein VcgC/VcgE DUF2780